MATGQSWVFGHPSLLLLRSGSGRRTVSAKTEKGPLRRGRAHGMLLPFSFLLQPPYRLTQKKENSSSGVRGDNYHFQTLETIALILGAHHPSVEFAISRKALLSPLPFPWRVGHSSLPSKSQPMVSQPLFCRLSIF